MRITRVPFAVLRFQYQLVRFPLQVLEERVVARMGTEAPARLFYERSLGVLDATVGTVLGDSRLRRRGALSPTAATRSVVPLRWKRMRPRRSSRPMPS